MSGKRFRMKGIPRVQVEIIGPCVIRQGAKLKHTGVIYRAEDGVVTVRGIDEFSDKFEELKE